MCTTSLLVLSSVFVLYATSLEATVQTNACLLQCMREVLKCKRGESLGFLSETSCCDKYSMCYFMCEPEATTAPSCSSGTTASINGKIIGKRGSWNKRFVPRGTWLGKEAWTDANNVDDDFREDDIF